MYHIKRDILYLHLPEGGPSRMEAPPPSLLRRDLGILLAERSRAEPICWPSREDPILEPWLLNILSFPSFPFPPPLSRVRLCAWRPSNMALSSNVLLSRLCLFLNSRTIRRPIVANLERKGCKGGGGSSLFCLGRPI